MFGHAVYSSSYSHASCSFHYSYSSCHLIGMLKNTTFNAFPSLSTGAKIHSHFIFLRFFDPRGIYAPDATYTFIRYHFFESGLTRARICLVWTFSSTWKVEILKNARFTSPKFSMSSLTAFNIRSYLWATGRCYIKSKSVNRLSNGIRSYPANLCHFEKWILLVINIYSAINS